MPEKRIEFPYKPDQSFDKEKYVMEQIEKYKEHFRDELSVIDNISDERLKCLCVFAMIDSMAYESNAYETNKRDIDVFCDFVLSCTTRYGYLDKIEPITLYYHVESRIHESVKIPGFPSEKDIEMYSLQWDGVMVKDAMESGFSKEIIEYLEKVVTKEYIEKKKKEHRFVNLLYRMRSKLAHELSGIGIQDNFDKEMHSLEEPYYSDIGRGYVENGYVVSDDVAELHIPYIFLRRLLEDCFDSYLCQCASENRSPYSNKMTRQHVLSWYDK